MSFGNTKRNGGGSSWWQLVDWGGRLILGWPNIGTYREVSADNDYSTGVPVDEHWEILSVNVVYTATATVGNRSLVLEITNTVSGIVTTAPTTALIVANDVINVTFANGLAVGVLAGTHITVPTAAMYAATGWGMRLYDVNNIDVADTMDVTFMYKNYPEVP